LGNFRLSFARVNAVITTRSAANLVGRFAIDGAFPKVIQKVPPAA